MEMDTGKFRIYRILKGGIDTSPVEKNCNVLHGITAAHRYIFLLAYTSYSVGKDGAKDHIDEIDVQRLFIAVGNWPNFKLNRAFVCKTC